MKKGEFKAHRKRSPTFAIYYEKKYYLKAKEENITKEYENTF
jgi:hypothetical protein